MVVQSQDLRPGMTVEIDNNIFVVIEYNHIKMARGGAVIRVKMKNIRNGATIEKTFKSGEKIKRAQIDRKQMQFLYADDEVAHFMDQENYTQIGIDLKTMGDSIKYLKDGDVVQVTFYEEESLGVDLPAAVPLKVTDTPPGIKGNTVSGGSKDATMETGIVVKVPLFINNGDKIKVDTRTGKYLERV
ncbi:MAG: elongation factor P [Candidatus Margulisbacteria bacterium]|nr:elongation factor P [Candidatus Margulisiibacteriota bacterium]MBU1021074.1 elongation factor P [Candidatus Margulisiibacteriota bacterium]MBU1729883.1 elongation factor P [Candidatus Margulisiibacteriota bacterium]MBU1955213.1 elongation factor P [Candidatus Margulisiibacteriota bacterium]